MRWGSFVLIAFVSSMCANAQGQEDAKKPASQRYSEAIAALVKKRPSRGEVYQDEPAGKPKTGEKRDGDTYVQYEERTYKAAAKLKDLVFQDNSDGFVFPGSLLWMQPLREGRFVPVPTTESRPVVNSVIAGGTSAEQSPAFEHNGTFLDFQRKSDTLVKKIDRTSPRLAVEIGYGKSLASALLNVGVSAKMWSASFGAGLSQSSLEQRSFAVLSLSEVYYTIVADTPGQEGYFPPAALDKDRFLGEHVLKKLPEYGEIGYVRSVKYGRRVMIAVSANATEEQLKRSLNVSASGFGLEFKGSLDDQTKKVWETMDARAVVIGGKVTGALADAVTGGPAKFLENINRYLKDTAAFDAQTGPLPVAFEVSYTHDNEPMVNYETLEFAGRIVTKRSRAEETVKQTKDVELTGADARLIHEDEEIDTDDWTKMDVRYSLSVIPDRRAVELKLTMNAYECEDDKRYNKETHIRTEKTIRLYTLADSDPRKIRTIDAAPKSDFMEEMFGGELHNWFGFPSFGALRDITVHVDGPDGKDLKQQGLKAKIDFVVEIDRER